MLRQKVPTSDHNVTALPNIQSSLTPKKHFDHGSHEAFVSVDELHRTDEEREWNETARFINYEEDVEDESLDRWGSPHVASLSFHSLLNLSRFLEKGVVLIDIEERDLTGISYRIVEQVNGKKLCSQISLRSVIPNPFQL